MYRLKNAAHSGLVFRAGKFRMTYISVHISTMKNDHPKTRYLENPNKKPSEETALSYFLNFKKCIACKYNYFYLNSLSIKVKEICS